MNDIAVLVSQYLNLDMLRILDIFLDEDGVVAERLLRLTSGSSVLLYDAGLIPDNTHAPAAAAGRCLQHDRITDLIGELNYFFVCLNGLLNTRDERNTHLVRHDLRLDLVSQPIHHRGIRADEFNSCLLAGIRKIRILRQEAISRMNCVNTLRLRQLNNLIDAQISIDRCLAFSDLICLICLRAEQRRLVLFGIDRYCTDTQLFTGTENSNRDLAAVSDQHSLELLDFSHFKTPVL